MHTQTPDSSHRRRSSSRPPSTALGGSAATRAIHVCAARISGAARDPGRVGRRNRAVAPATRPGHHRAARQCRRSRPEVPHGPGRRPRREAALRGAKPRPTGRRARPLTSPGRLREGRGGRKINLIINCFNKRPVEINKDRRADRSVPAETGGRTGSSEPRPVKKTGAPGTLRPSLARLPVAAARKWQPESLRARVNYGGSSHGDATLALASPSAEAPTHGPRMARTARAGRRRASQVSPAACSTHASVHLELGLRVNAAHVGHAAGHTTASRSVVRRQFANHCFCGDHQTSHTGSCL